MRYMIMIKSVEGAAGPPPPALMEAIAALGAEATKNGTMVGTGGLLPTAAGARVRLKSGKLTVTDGPFTEAKEVVGGYAVFDLASKEEAIRATELFMALHAEHWPGFEGEAEIRQMMIGPPGFDCPANAG